MDELHDLQLMLSGHVPIIAIETLEEPRLLQQLTRLGLRLPHPMYQWSLTEGISPLGAALEAQPQTAEPRDALGHIKAMSRPGYFVLLDLHPFLGDPLHVRLLKEIAQQHPLLAKTLVLVSHRLEIPAELRHLSARFELHLPDRAGLLHLIREEAEAWRTRNQRPPRVDQAAVDLLADNLLGVSATDARRIVRSAIENDGAITRSDLPEVTKAKYELIGQDGLISFEYDTARFKDVAGLQHLKEWLLQRRQALLGPRGALEPPRGIMLLGVQGCGKSLAAKAVAGTFGLPLLRLDFAGLYDKYIGETEKNLRRALQTAEVMAPCVLWLDEMEKGIASGSADEGLSRRILGTLLTWMAERSGNVFMVATSNAIEQLPPELVRKGRLDEIFFVDLPDQATREAVFSIHLRRRNLAPSGFALAELAAVAEGFSGAEIEQAIVSGLYLAQSRNDRLDDRHLREELERTRPLSVTMAERIARLRAWAAERTVPAG